MPTPEEALKAFWDSADAYNRNVKVDNYKLDPELQKNLTTIYGDISKLNQNTINNLKNTWSKNPQFIINTAQQKNNTQEKNPISIKQPQFDSPNFAMGDTGLNPLDKSKGPIQLFSGGVRAAQQWLKEHNYGNIIADDMYGAKTDAAINTALQDENLDSGIRNQLRALQEQYKGKWVPQKKKIVNSQSPTTQQNTTPITENISTDNLTAINGQYSINPDLIQTTKGRTFGRGVSTITGSNEMPSKQRTEQTQSRPQVNNVRAATNRYTMGNTVQGDFGIGRTLRKVGQTIGNGFVDFLNWLNEGATNNQYNRNRQVNQFGYYQQGGNLNNMNQQEILKKAFINYLVQVTGAKTEQDLAKLGQDQIKQLYQQFTTGIQDGSIEVSQDGQVNVKGRKAALGAKLSYFNKLQGKCPEGQQLVTFKIGGRMCTACQKGNKVEKKQTTNQNINQQPKKLDPEKTPVLPGGKYPSYWTADDRIKWERKYGQKDEGAAVSPPPRKNQLGAALQLLLNKNR